MTGIAKENAKSICIQFTITAHPADEWEYNDPTFNFLDEIALIDWSIPKEDWERYRVVGMLLAAPRWECGTLMQQPVWYYSLRNERGTGDTLWVPEEAIAPVSLLHTYANDDHF